MDRKFMAAAGMAALCIWVIGCGDKNPVSGYGTAVVQQEGTAAQPEAPKRGVVTARLGEEEISLKELLVSAYTYDEDADSFICMDAARLSKILPKEAGTLPVILWEPTFELIIPEDLELAGIDIFTADFEKQEFSCEGGFSQLPPGIYYGAVEVHWQGAYIQSKGEYESAVLQYAFCLDKQEE